MPNVWLISVIQHLAQQIQQQLRSATSDQQQPQQKHPQDAGQEKLRVEPSHIAQVLETLPMLGVNWSVVQATEGRAVSQLTAFSHASVL